MGKERIVAETGAGQHGTATAMAASYLDIDCEVFMGRTDINRQRPNVFRMRIHDAEVNPVDVGSGTLKEAINETMRDWATNVEDTHYVIGASSAHTRSRRWSATSSRSSARKRANRFGEQVGPTSGQRRRLCGRRVEHDGRVPNFVDDETVSFRRRSGRVGLDHRRGRGRRAPFRLARDGPRRGPSRCADETPPDR